MEALSPRSTNIPSKLTRTYKMDVEEKRKSPEDAATAKAAEKRAEKERNHASAPPQLVLQPPGPDGSLEEKYMTGRLLGKGGFAICHEAKLMGAKHRGKGNRFALKIVKAKMGIKKMEEKFRTELQIHSKMRHPNIVEFHRAFTYLENTYIVLELCPHGSVMDMLCGAIKYMHARNVIHRDLKMGNLFLDQDMNIKIGDFGLAAVLVTESEVKGAASRRTTLCGTPNYIAPEILERGKKGHDHKVDIWAIGVILFAMITGFPPFASTTQDDIYRKVKTLDYVWPTEKCSNDIPEEAMDLVANLLRSKAEERPDPDEIVAHPFFSMHGCQAIPSSIGSECCTKRPDWIGQDVPRGDCMSLDVKKVSIFDLAIQCGVGHFPEMSGAFPVVGQDVGRSLYKEFLEEEAAGLTPMVPLPDDTVYSYFASESPETPTETRRSDPQMLPQVLPIRPATLRIVGDGPRRPPAEQRSHAAQLRSEAHPRAIRTVNRPMLEAAKTGPGVQHLTLTTSKAVRRGADAKDVPQNVPMRAPAAKGRSEGSKSRTLSRNASNPDSGAVAGRSQESRVRSKTMTQSTVPRAPSSQSVRSTSTSEAAVSKSETEPSIRSTRMRTRIASTVAKELEDNAPTKKTATTRTIQDRIPSSSSTSSVSERSGLLIGPNDTFDTMSHTKPHEVLHNLRILSGRLASELADSVLHPDVDPTVTEKPSSLSSRPVVVKWVDYTNKFGIGYILANGDVGCVFNGAAERPSTCVVVPAAEEHLKKRKTPSYAHKAQLVPHDGAAIAFFENGGELGVRRVTAPSSTFQIPVSPAGEVGKLVQSADVFENERRRTLILWDKFANYMTQSLSPGEDLPPPEEPARRAARRAPTKPPLPTTTLVRFYQRLGNVGVWGFGDGSFQFNFPDHTKLVVAADGAWVDFYHLSLHAATSLKERQTLPKAALDERGVLAYPLAVLLRGRYRGMEFGDLVEANKVRAKVEFVRRVVEGWVRGGGLGLGERVGVWEGVREGVGAAGRERLVWVTVGAKGGDRRVEGVVKKA